MKKYVYDILILLLCLIQAEGMAEEQLIPDFAVFSGDVYTLTEKTEFDHGVYLAYEASFEGRNKASLWGDAMHYISWLTENLTPQGAYQEKIHQSAWKEQAACWFRFKNDYETKGLSFDFGEKKAENCHVLVSVKTYEDKYEIEIYAASGTGFFEFRQQDKFFVPSIESYLKNVFFIRKDESTVMMNNTTGIDALEQYLDLIEKKYGMEICGKYTQSDMFAVCLQNSEKKNLKTTCLSWKEQMSIQGHLIILGRKQEDKFLLKILYSPDCQVKDNGDRYEAK